MYCRKGCCLTNLKNMQWPFSLGVPKGEIQQWRQALSRPGEKENLNIMLRGKLVRMYGPHHANKVYIFIHLWTYTYIYIYIYILENKNICICICIHIYIYIYIWILEISPHQRRAIKVSRKRWFPYMSNFLKKYADPACEHTGVSVWVFESESESESEFASESDSFKSLTRGVRLETPGSRGGWGRGVLPRADVSRLNGTMYR